jgi:hypothetical protein
MALARRCVLGLTLLAVGTAVSCVGDSFVDYEVVNNTDEELLTWATTHGCDDSPGYREDYLETEMVPAHSRFHYSKSSFGSLKCAWVTTVDRHVIIADHRTYHDATFAVDEPVAVRSAPIPGLDQLPERSLWENLDPRGGPPLYWIVLFLAGSGIIASGFLTARALLRSIKRAGALA